MHKFNNRKIHKELQKIGFQGIAAFCLLTIFVTFLSAFAISILIVLYPLVLSPETLVQKEKKARSTLGSLQRASQVYWLENEAFAPAIDNLDVKLSEKYYYYKIQEIKNNSNFIVFEAIPKEANLRSYSSLFYVKDASKLDGFVMGICVTNKPSKNPPDVQILKPFQSEKDIRCGKNSQTFIHDSSNTFRGD